MDCASEDVSVTYIHMGEWMGGQIKFNGCFLDE